MMIGWWSYRALDKPLKASVVQTKTPLEAAQSMAHLKGGRATEEERAKINQGLWQEQRVFMEKLHRKRAQRRHLEVSQCGRPSSSSSHHLHHLHHGGIHASLTRPINHRRGMHAMDHLSPHLFDSGMPPLSSSPATEDTASVITGPRSTPC
jgi:hypothetical protein